MQKAVQLANLEAQMPSWLDFAVQIQRRLYPAAEVDVASTDKSADSAGNDDEFQADYHEFWL